MNSPEDERISAACSLEDPEVIRALCEYREALAAGHPLPRHDVLREFPQLQDELRNCLDALDMMQDMAGRIHKSGYGGPVRPAVRTPPDSQHLLGDFRLIREIGCGGIGCTNNLKQLGLGLQNYHNALRVFPAANVTKPQQHNWVAFFLPYIEESNIYYLYHWNLDFDAPANQDAVNRVIEILHCPSTPEDPSRTDKLPSGLTTSTCDYGPASRVDKGLIDAGFLSRPASLEGIMGRDRWGGLAAVTDGSSNTMIITEDAGRPAFWTARGHGPKDNTPGCANWDVQNGRAKGAGWSDIENVFPLHGFSPDGLVCPGPCGLNCTNNNEAFSFHPGGINAAFADGSVHFIAETVSLQTYAALITRAGGEVIGADGGVH